MCEATAIVAAAVAIGTTAYQVDQAREQRKGAESLRRYRQEEEEAAARESMQIAAERINEDLQQTQEAAAAELEKSHRRAAAAASRATVIGGEMGAFGANHTALLREIYIQETQFNQAVSGSLRMAQEAAARDTQEARLGFHSRLVNARTLPTPQPNYVGYALQGIDTGFRLYPQIKGATDS